MYRCKQIFLNDRVDFCLVGWDIIRKNITWDHMIVSAREQCLNLCDNHGL